MDAHIARSTSVTAPTTLPALARLLESHDIDCSKWGRDGTKSVSDLLEEIRSGETRLSRTGRTLLREVRVVNIDVLAENEAGRLCRLREVKQVFPDGSERRRNTGCSVAEKVLGEEELETAARRGLREEIRLSDPVELRALKPSERVRSSESYPGLDGKYLIYPGFVRLTAEQRDAITLEERKNGRTTFFAWEPI